jgi:hypothetical protein
MLREWLTSLRTRCPPDLVALGYRYAAVACLYRADRCAGDWAPHQRNTRQAILDAMRDASPACDTALVLGSGPCLDLPIPELLARFPRLLLVDVAHPPPALRLASRYPTIELVARDLTGMAVLLSSSDVEPPTVPVPTVFLDDPRIGLVVSANLVSQLPLVPLRRMAKRWPQADQGALGHAIVAAHVTYLSRFTCPVLLIGDVERHVLDADGKRVEQDDPLFGVGLPWGREWDWQLAPVGELSSGWSIVNRVRAVRLDPHHSRIP